MTISLYRTAKYKVLYRGILYVKSGDETYARVSDVAIKDLL